MHLLCSVYGWKSLYLVIGTTVTQSRYLARPKRRGSEPYRNPHETMDSNNSSGRAGRHGRIGARGPGKGRMPGFRSTIHYKQTKGPDGWRIPNLDRSTVFYRPNQTSRPSPPVGDKRPAVYVPDAGGVELQPCLLYTSPSPRDLSTSRMPSSA